MKKLSIGISTRKKTVFFVMIVFMIVLIANICIYAATDDLVKSTTLPNARAYQFYNERIEMRNEEEEYTFELAKNSMLPKGLSISEDGVITGTPTVSGTYCAIKIDITDSVGKTVTKKFTMRVKARDIEMKILIPAPAPYDGDPHDATVQFYDLEGNLIEDLGEPKVTYGTARTEHAIEAGTHIVNVTTPSGCRIVNDITRTVTIEHLPVNELYVQGFSVPYDGDPHGITEENVTVDPISAGFAVEYRKQGESDYTLDEPVTVGVYEARVHTNNTNYVTTYASATIIIEGEKIDFNATDTPFEYNGEGQAPVVTATRNDEPFTGFTISYTDSVGRNISDEDLKDGKPYKAGTYRINITLDEPDKYTVGSFTNNTFTIAKKEVIFRIPQRTYSYKANEDNVPTQQEPVINPEPEGFKEYTVQYQRLTDEGAPIGEPTDYVAEIGTYRVIYTLTDTDNYTFGTGSVQYITVADKTMNFEIYNLTKTYKRDTAQYADITVTTDDGIVYENHYEVVYTQNNVEVAEPTNAGRYFIEIKPIHGHGIGTQDPENPYLVINKQTVTFSVQEDETTAVDYDGNDHAVNIVHNEDADIADDEYTVKYRNKATKAETDAAHDAGEYDIVVKVTNSNYQAASEVIGTFTVNTTYEFMPGNSPAAMIFKDASKTDEQKQAIFEEFKTSREFTAENVPEGCVAGIRYPEFAPIKDDCDLDMNPSTVILTDIADYQEPGIKINGVEKTNGVLEAVEGMENLYTVTYNGDSSIKRYIMIVSGRIGDVSGEGILNAIDANYLDKLDRPAQTINEARLWDVNKDGNIDRADATAIRRRFSEKLAPYYPWVNNN